MKSLSAKSIELLKLLIATPSISKEEHNSARIIFAFLKSEGIEVRQQGNNVWAKNKYFENSKPTLLLNSHHDTVRPSSAWTKNPHEPFLENGKLFGLGSNDAGGALCSMIAVFLHFHEKQIPFNLVLTASAEEEISGSNGIERILPELGRIDFAMVGEPTQMNLAIAEKGLLVIDCLSMGKTGHAARHEGENAIYNALKAIEWFKNFQFPKISKTLGPIKMSVTMIQAGKQHNVIPDTCSFTIDIRVTDEYTHEELLEIITEHVDCQLTPRSMRLRSSSISENHPIVLAGKKLGLQTFGSPTTSDQALMNFPSVKIGPGDSARSHTADEFIYLHEIEKGIETYIELLNQYATINNTQVEQLEIKN